LIPRLVFNKESTMRSLLVLLATLVATNAAANNLLPNPSFSSSDVSRWMTSGQVAHRYVGGVGSDLDGGSGPGALEVTYSYYGGAWNGARVIVDDIGPGIYDVGGTFLIPSDLAQGQELTVVVEFRDHNGNTLARLNSGFVTSSGAWTASQRSLEAPPGTTHARVYAAVYTPNGSPEGTPPSVGLFDDLFFNGNGGTVQELFVPAAASAPGQNGTQWTTGGWIANATDTTLTVSAALMPEGTNNIDRLVSARQIATIPPRGSIRIEDVVAAVGESKTGGGLYLSAKADTILDPPLMVVTTHTFTPNPEGAGTFGQGIPALSPGTSGSKLLPGAVQNSDFRTNVGVLNTTAWTVDVDFIIRNGDGVEIASTTWRLAPYEWRQEGLPSFGVTDLANGSIEIISEEWVSYQGYASTVDQNSGDAVFSQAR
jgi:hypothetical protein